MLTDAFGEKSEKWK